MEFVEEERIAERRTDPRPTPLICLRLTSTPHLTCLFFTPLLLRTLLTHLPQPVRLLPFINSPFLPPPYPFPLSPSLSLHPSPSRSQALPSLTAPRPPLWRR
jgi:hypothetical protein